jgi:hypothetical protein
MSQAVPVDGVRSHGVLIDAEGFASTTRRPVAAITPASLDALLAHLLASRFAHTFVNRLLKSRFAMRLSRGVDGSPEVRRRRGRAFYDWVRFVFLRRLANGHSSFPGFSISRLPQVRQHNLLICGFAFR